MKRIIGIVLVVFLMVPLSAFAAGTLQPVGSGNSPIQIVNHHVEVTINNGFAQTEVTQTFKNPNNKSLEALYSFPLPKSASLSGMTIITGEKILKGEVVAKKKADKIYKEEKESGNDAGKASKESYQRFEFRVTPIPAGETVTITFVYYQPLKIDTGMGRYLYPIEEGGTDEEAKAFWSRNDKIEQEFSARITLKSAWPIDGVRVPGFKNEATTNKLEDGTYEVEIVAANASLNKDLVFYYRLSENLPGRVEVIPYRDDPKKPGTFMMVLTPGIDLKPLNKGADYIFVLDVSGSMEGKLSTLIEGVLKTLETMNPQDRFKVVTFSDRADDLTGWVSATKENVIKSTKKIQNLKATNGTNIYEGMLKALKSLNADRATSVILVTDGVANQGIVDPEKFAQLSKLYDVRIFGFLLGNSANWPLMKVICNASGGFYAGVSNSDDIIGQLELAKSKVLFEALHDVELKISGPRTFDLTQTPTKIYRGEQIVILGRYQKEGNAKLTLKASITGQDKSYTTDFVFPKIDKSNPELERLWAMDAVEKIQLEEAMGKRDTNEAKKAVEDLGVNYQIVTDETSMLVLSDEAFKRHGIERKNVSRTQKEQIAQESRMDVPVVNHRVDNKKPAFKRSAPSFSRGGGALDPEDIALLSMILLAAIVLSVIRKKEDKKDENQ